MFGKKWPMYSEAEIEAVSAVLRSGKVNYWTGEQGKLFEKEYAEHLGLKHAIAVANGTNALELCLHALDVGFGDEVIVPCRTFMASASCVVQVGAKPVICDVDFETQNLTVETIAPHVTSKTKAIIAVHLGGLPCDMMAIMAFAKEKGLYVIEDCAQAHGAKINGKAVGSFGDMAAFSFCQDKIISTMGEGGLVATNNSDWFKAVWAYKDHGKGYDTVFHKTHLPGFRWLHDTFGSNYRMTEAQAAVGRIQLQKLSEWQKLRERNANIFKNALTGLDGVRLIRSSPNITHAYYRFYLFVEKNRDRIMAEINEQGIWCQVGVCSRIDLEKAFVDRGYQYQHILPNAKLLGETGLALLVDPLYDEHEVQKAAGVVAAVLQTASQ